MSSLFHRLPPEITDAIFDIVGEGLRGNLSKYGRVALTEKVYDSLMSFEHYLRKERAPCTRLDERGYLRRYRRRRVYPLELPPFKVPPFPVFEIVRRAYDRDMRLERFLEEVSACFAGCQLLPYLENVTSETPEHLIFSVRDKVISLNMTRDLSEANALGISFRENVLSRNDVGLLGAWRILLGSKVVGEYTHKNWYSACDRFPYRYSIAFSTPTRLGSALS